MGVEQIVQTLQGAVTTAQHTAEMAMNNISNHEKVCTERYASIQKGQENTENKIDNLNDVLIPKIFETLGAQNKILYIGMGIFIGIPLVIGFCYGVYEIIKSVAK